MKMEIRKDFRNSIQYGSIHLRYVETVIVKKSLINIDNLLKLKGKTLGCWCKQDNDNIEYHGDILIVFVVESMS